jgi:hypothetical protein
VLTQSLFGFGILALSVSLMTVHFARFATINTLESGLLPFVLSVFFLPPLVAGAACLVYGDAFALIGSQGTARNVRQVKWRIVRRFGLNLPALQKFRRTGGYLAVRGACNAEEAARILETNWLESEE